MSRESVAPSCRRALALLAGLFALTSVTSRLSAQSGSPEPVGREPASGDVALFNSQVYRLRSQINGREYRILVALPVQYRDAPTPDTTRYSVLYLLDGDLELPLMARMFRLSNRGVDGSGETIVRNPAGVILVGVGYPRGADLGAPAPGGGQVPYRMRDYSPPPFPGPKPERRNSDSEQEWAGGATQFLRVLRDEVIPFIDGRYRTTAERGLHGHSIGGLFVAYALFTDPDLFTKYAITSPALWWDEASIFLREAELARNRTTLHKQVFLSVGGLEGADEIADVWRMVSVLCHDRAAGRFAGLQLTAEIIPDEYHGSAVPFSRALKALYPPFPNDSGLTRNPCPGR